MIESMLWTIIEDPKMLDGASIEVTSDKFEQWVKTDGRDEMQGSIFTDNWVYCPRYIYFIHVDDESLESVVNDQMADQDGGYFLTVVREDMVRLRRSEQAKYEADGVQRENGGYDKNDEERELLDLRKKVRADQLVDLYVVLLNIDLWYNIWVDSGIAVL
jgi:hypothetical protein